MSIKRLSARIPSAAFLGSTTLIGHRLKFNKPSLKDKSGKCNAAICTTEDEVIWGAIFSIRDIDLPALDKFEGQGSGYDRKTIKVESAIDSNESRHQNELSIYKGDGDISTIISRI